MAGKKELGISSLVVIIAQVISTFQGTGSVQNEIKELKKEIHESSIERERFFVRKSDIEPMKVKIDSVHLELSDINRKITRLAGKFKKQSDIDPGFVGSDFEMHFISPKVDRADPL